MQPTQNTYPVFEANQVLTNRHLNQVFDYLDEQERLTRANLIGIGIVCGLEIIQTGTNIHLSKGCGVTSQGYLIIEPNDVDLVAYKTYKLPADIEYPLFRTLSEDDLLWEMFPLGEPNSTSLETPANFLQDKAVLLFLELKNEGLRNCSPNNCDDKGAEVTATVRRLLINKNDLDALDANSNLVKFQSALYGLPEIPLPRPNFSLPGSLQNIEQTYKNYFAAISSSTTVVSRLAVALNDMYQLLLNLIPSGLNNSGISQLPATFAGINASTNPMQYYFDLLRDLTAGYHELRDNLLEQVAICLPNDLAFPRHLSLGLLSGQEVEKYRTSFFPSPSVATHQYTLRNIHFLFERLNQMVLNFNIPTSTTIPTKITPSIWGTKYLTGKSMPFYYNSTLRSRWDSHFKGNQVLNIISWHDDIASPDAVRHPLNYNLEPYNFFRFEGHVGKNLLTISSVLANLIKDNRLAISILHLNADALGSFLEKHYAIEHEAGTWRGGTLVVLHRGAVSNLVLADFALPYRIEEKTSSCLCRVEVMECEYEWIDTRRHLSNLALREYRYGSRPAVHTPSQQNSSQEHSRKNLDDYYVIRIYKYEIQGSPLVTQPVDIKIPIAELISGQLSAIARAFNEVFPGGIIFDYKPNTNKLLIRYFSDQTFRLEFRGLQGNQMLYAYSNGKIERWQQKKWELFDGASNYQVVCRLRNEYRSDEYKWLHEDTRYEAVYPSPAPMATSAELIQWEKMIYERAKLDLPIQNVLNAIRDWASESMTGGAQIKIVLIGSWANGSWVPRRRIRTPSNTFLNLRQKITGKRANEHSDIDLLITFDNDYTLERIQESIENLPEVEESGYKINIVMGKKDAQKGRKII